MKWSELFASILGDKDTDVTKLPESHPTTPSVPPVPTTKPSNTTTEQLHIQEVQQPSNNSPTTTTAPNFTQEQFDALNARIKELEQANKDLALKGTVDAPPAMSPEEIIFNLCVGRSNNGKQDSNTNTSEHSNR